MIHAWIAQTRTVGWFHLVQKELHVQIFQSQTGRVWEATGEAPV